jgi:hypothetical protein
MPCAMHLKHQALHQALPVRTYLEHQALPVNFCQWTQQA